METGAGRSSCRYLCIGLPVGIPDKSAKCRQGAPLTSQALAGLQVEQASKAYRVYLRYTGPGDIFVRSTGEHFIDVSAYLLSTGADPRDLACELACVMLAETGMRIVVGAGTNLFLAKVARDRASQTPSGVAVLDEASFRRDFWLHRPMTDLWGFRPGMARRLHRLGLWDLASVAAEDEEVLYREFGAEAEYLIDHAWGMEPCTLQQVLRSRVVGSSISRAALMPSKCASWQIRRLIREMADELHEELAADGLGALSLALHLGYRSAGDAACSCEPSLGASASVAVGHLASDDGRTCDALDYTCRSRLFAAPAFSVESIAAEAERLFAEGAVPGATPWRISVTLRDLTPVDAPAEPEPTLRLLEAKVARSGAHVARNHAGRARQFMSFPACWCYSDMVAKSALDAEAA